MSISLLFPPGLRVGGETLYGEVELHFPLVHQDEIEEVHVKLRGSVYAKVARQYGNQYFDRRERIEIVRDNVSVWTRGSAYPPAECPVLRLPFKFVLPTDVQPSCQYSGVYKHGHVGYAIEVVGVRPGALKANRRVLRPFPVVPRDFTGAPVRYALQTGWTGEWNTIERSNSIRRGLWGGYANVNMKFKLPAIESLPLFTRIPFSLQVVTMTKQMKFEDIDENVGERPFPAPPLHPQEVYLRLRRHIALNAHGWTAKDTEDVSPLGGMGKSAKQDTVELDIQEKKWIPSEDDKNVGCWMQDTNMRSTIELKYPTSFQTHAMTVSYTLRLKIGFPGIGNNLEADIPVQITSGMLTPPDPHSISGEGVPPYEGPPPALDLPPTYWAASDWDQDEKAPSYDGPGLGTSSKGSKS